MFQPGEIMLGSMWEVWLLTASDVPQATIDDWLARQWTGENIIDELNWA
jgi:hypothetical protein